tara:strand:- start:70 stop:378 length:309 start_codon:yes stop_codon:yes gene_type:complete
MGVPPHIPDLLLLELALDLVMIYVEMMMLNTGHGIGSADTRAAPAALIQEWVSGAPAPIRIGILDRLRIFGAMVILMEDGEGCHYPPRPGKGNTITAACTKF